MTHHSFRKTKKLKSQKSKKSKSRNKKKKMKGGLYWNNKSKEEQVLANRTLTGRKNNPEIKECIGSDNKVVNVKFNLNDLPYNSPLSPIKIFKRDSSNFSDLENGVHNFILFWDDINNQYVLTTSYFTALEFASKHFMLSKRLSAEVPEHFIMSGEIKKYDNNIIEFHDTSSFYIDSVPNFKTGFLIYYFTRFLQDPKNQRLAFIDMQNNFVKSLRSIQGITLLNPFIGGIMECKNVEEMYATLTFNNTPFTASYKGEPPPQYIQEITNIMNDAIKDIFNDPNLNVVYTKFSVDNVQLDKSKFYDDMCNKDPPYSFDYYADNESCQKEENSIGNTCETLKKRIKRF